MPVATLPTVTAARRRVQRWWLARLPLSDTTTLTQRNVYIMPTRPGLMLAATLLVLLLASINYQLNLGYLLTFLLAGNALVGMHVCHGTLRGLTLTLIPPEPVFARSRATLSVQLHNAKRSTRHAVALSVTDTGRWGWTDVPGEGSAMVQVAFEPQRRGQHKLPTLTAETRYPMGTFRAWTVWSPAAPLLVYPAPEAHPPPLPQGEPRAGGTGLAHAPGLGEYDGVRAYRRGDPLKLVVWKKAAKTLETGGGALVSRDTQTPQRHALWLDHAQAGGADLEQRLSRLCAWVIQAEARGLDYGLRLPNLQLPPHQGLAHQRRCLEALALC